MDPDAVERMPFLRKEGLLHAAIMDQQTLVADSKLEEVRAEGQAWIRGIQKRGNARR